MPRYSLVIISVFGLALLLTGMAAACDKNCAGTTSRATESCACECHQSASELKTCKNAGKDTEFQAKCTVKSVDLDTGEVVIVPEGGAEAIPVIMEKSYAERLRTGDKLLVTYESRRVNVATRVFRQYTIKNTPKPCVECLPEKMQHRQ